MIKNVRISNSQLFLMLLVSRMFSMFAYRPQGQSLSAAASALAIAAATAVNFMIFLPAVLISAKSSEKSVADTVCTRFKTGGKIFLALCAVLCIYVAVQSLTGFQMFMTCTVYTVAPAAFFIIPVIVAAIYICRLGLETLSRLSSFVFGTIALTVLAVALISIGKAGQAWFTPLQKGDTPGFLESAADSIFHTAEVIPFIFLSGNVRKKSTGWASFFIVAAGVLFEIISLADYAALGGYKNALKFPFYTASTMAENILTERLDSVFITLWVFIAVIKLCVYLYTAAAAFRKIFNFKTNALPLYICSLSVAVVSLILSSGDYNGESMTCVLISGALLVVSAVVFPLLSLLRHKKGAN